jgi:hypothetical protein
MCTPPERSFESAGGDGIGDTEATLAQGPQATANVNPATRAAIIVVVRRIAVLAC